MKLRRNNVFFLLEVYALSILCFTLFRCLLLSLHINEIHYTGAERTSLLARAFLIGLRFDTAIACYLLAPVFLLLGLLAITGQLRPWSLRVGYWFTAVLFIIAFFFCAADIPFYQHFFRRLDDTIFAWKGHTGFGVQMILQESSYYWFLLLFILLSCVYAWLLTRICKSHISWWRLRSIQPGRRAAWIYTPVFLVLVGLLVLGIRGRTEEKTPLGIGAAFICDDPTVNLLGLNPVFTLIRSVLDGQLPENQRLHWIDDTLALQTTAALLHADPQLSAISPIARMESPGSELAGRNVVLVIMESMSTAKMRRFGNQDNLTPFLDSLAQAAWSFDNIWSAGLHTYNGVYSTLMGHPALMKKHPMEQVLVPEVDGLPIMLRRQGYHTLFFTTHDELFDNMSGFLSANGMDQIIGQKDYPANEVKSTMGVPDEYMFRFAIPVLNKAVAAGKPFFAAFMTGTDHDPIVIPEGVGFTPRHSERNQQSVAFADWSLRRLLEYASKQDWYSNTLFVFIADHGSYLGFNAYDVPFSYNHIPLVMFAPGYTSSKSFTDLGLQTDVPSTVAGMVLTRPYLNLTLSTNLLKTQKHLAIFSCDDKLACMNDSLLYVYRTGNQPPGLYQYLNNDTRNYYYKDSLVALPLRLQAFSWLQTSQWLLENKKAAKR